MPPMNAGNVPQESNNYRRVPPNRPNALPFEPTEENIPMLKQYIIEQFSKSAFDRTAPFPIITGPPAHIHLRPDAKPSQRHTANKIPHHLAKPAKESLSADVSRIIIRHSYRHSKLLLPCSGVH